MLVKHFKTDAAVWRGQALSDIMGYIEFDQDFTMKTSLFHFFCKIFFCKNFCKISVKIEISAKYLSL